MTLDPLTQPAADFARDNELFLTPEGRERLQPGLTTRAYFDMLRRDECLADARRVLAHALPKRRALWWGLLCAWEAARPRLADNVAGVLQAVAAFVIAPDEEKRRALQQVAGMVRLASPAHQLAQAAFYSFGSMTEPDLPELPAPPFVTGRLVGVAVYLASVAREPLKYPQRLGHYINVGLEVARGQHLWTAPLPAKLWTETNPSEQLVNV